MGTRFDSSKDETPQHQVRLAKAFAVGQFEVTFDEWDECVAEGGCNGYRPDDEGWDRGARPVINVSWNDANVYTAWLAKKTGKPYRLLSESEYEYATRAGTTTYYPWGDHVGVGHANCCNSGRGFADKTAPVGSFPANDFGLYDMVGNVWELTQDCYHDNYEGAPADGSAWTGYAECLRAVRGCLPSACRVFRGTAIRQSDLGFRVARTLLAR